MKKKIKSALLNLAPGVIKNRLFKEQKKFSWHTIDTVQNEPEVLILEEIFAEHSNIVFFDIGCNKGEYIYAAEKFLIPAHIYAFEPNPKLFDQLKKIFPEIRLNKIAISDSNEKKQFKIPFINGVEDDSLGTLGINSSIDNETSSEQLEVVCKTLDSFVAENKIERIDIIKIDVEGFEKAVISGGINTISNHCPLMLIEIEKRHHPGQTVLSIIEGIKSVSAGIAYKVYYFNNAHKSIEAVTTEPHQQKEDWGTRGYINNFLFIPYSEASIAHIDRINAKLKTIFAKN